MRDSVFLCPKCGLPLQEGARTYVCARAHAFDRARSGYVNLYQTGRRGDTRAMLMARRAFLERDFFRPLAAAINDRVIDRLNRLRAARLCGDELIVDAGCGEGYFLERLNEQLRETVGFNRLRLVGLDASKDAARLTATRLPGHRSAVVDIVHGLHLRRGSAAVLLNVFAPRNPRAFAEALMPGGLCLVVMPCARHMRELRSLLPLLEIPPEKGARVAAQFRPYLTLMRSEDLHFAVELDADAVRAWVRMGPNAWHLTSDQVSTLQFPGTLTARAACTLLSFVK